MLRLSLLISLALVACTHPQAATIPQAAPATPAPVVAPPPPLERNFVCERVASEGNKKAICEPEYTAAGELLTHSARVTIDGITNVCAMSLHSPQVVCAPLFYVPQTDNLLSTETKPAKKAPAKPSKKK